MLMKQMFKNNIHLKNNNNLKNEAIERIPQSFEDFISYCKNNDKEIFIFVG